MEYTVKIQEYTGPTGYNIPVPPVMYDFFAPRTVKDELTGQEIQVNKKMCSHSLEDLQQRKAALENELIQINEKIAAIEAL